MDRALRPYPPVLVSFDGYTELPTSISGGAPVPVVWKRRNRLAANIRFDTDADEATEAGTEYVVRYGISGDLEEEILGDHTQTSGSFEFSYAGENIVEFFARKDGKESKARKFTLHVDNGESVIAAGGIGTSTITGLSATVTVTSEASAIPDVSISPPEASVDVTTEGDIGEASVEAIEGEAYETWD